MITAAMTISSASRPACEVMPLSWRDRISPAIVAQSEDMHVGADAHPVGRDAGVDRRLLVAAGGERLVAPARLGEHDRADGDDDERRSMIWLLKPSALVSPSWKNQL